MKTVCFYCGDTIPDALPHTCEGCGALLTLRLTSGTPMSDVDAAGRLNGYRMGLHITGSEALEQVGQRQGSFTLRLSGEAFFTPEASA